MSVVLGMPRPRPTGAAPTGVDAPAGTRAAVILPSERPAAAGLLDRFGREATDLRISLTDRCNLRCTYCMPAEGLPFLAPPALMSLEEITRFARIAVTEFGVRQVRFTGGEP